MQLTLNFDAGNADNYASCRELVAARVHQQGRPQKAIAADMDYSPSQLTRKCAQGENDSAKFTLDDLEKFIEVTKDLNPIFYLVEKYCKDARMEELEREIARYKQQGLV
jgi:hypothetical protein